MQKPANLKVVEFEDGLVNLINKFNLPAFVMKPIFERVYDKIVQLEQQQYDVAKTEYEESLKIAKKKGCDNK